MPEKESNRQRVHVRVSGFVQGVGFRWFCQRAALSHGLAGWVRNLRDGRVELEVEGPDGEVRAFLGEVRRGPAGARVADLQTGELPPEGDEGFTIRFDS